jgi:hypothetical protein
MTEARQRTTFWALTWRSAKDALGLYFEPLFDVPAALLWLERLQLKQIEWEIAALKWAWAALKRAWWADSHAAKQSRNPDQKG